MSAPLIGLVAHTGKAGALAMAARLRDEFEKQGGGGAHRGAHRAR